MPGQLSDTNPGKDTASSVAFSVAPAFTAPLSLPKGAGAIRGICEKFAANSVTGTGSPTIRIAASRGASGFGRQLLLTAPELRRAEFALIGTLAEAAATMSYKGRAGGGRRAEAADRAPAHALPRHLPRRPAAARRVESLGLSV
jgi:hypothetical protein